REDLEQHRGDRQQMRLERQTDRAAGAPPAHDEECGDAEHRRERRDRERPAFPVHAVVGRRITFTSLDMRPESTLPITWLHSLESHADHWEMGGGHPLRRKKEIPRKHRGAFPSVLLCVLCGDYCRSSRYHFHDNGGLTPSSSGSPALAAAAGLRMW